MNYTNKIYDRHLYGLDHAILTISEQQEVQPIDICHMTDRNLQQVWRSIEKLQSLDLIEVNEEGYIINLNRY